MGLLAAFYIKSFCDSHSELHTYILQNPVCASRPVKESPDFRYFTYNDIINHLVSHINPIIREFSSSLPKDTAQTQRFIQPFQYYRLYLSRIILLTFRNTSS